MRKNFWSFGIFLIVLVAVSFLIQETIINSKNISTKQKLAIIFSLSFIGFIIDLLFLIWTFFLERIAKRYISRNTRLYVNYLLDTEGFNKRLEKQEKSG